jgi:UDP-glucose 4-epimerase
MRNFLVTGGAGYIGRHIVKRALLAGDRIFILDDFSNSIDCSLVELRGVGTGSFEVIRADASTTLWHQAISRDLQIHAVLHLAAHKYNSLAIDNPIFYFRNNIDATLSVLKFMEDRNVKNLVFSSSAAVYGMPGIDPIREDAVLQPKTAYGLSKKICEEIIEHVVKKGDGFKAVVLRYFNPLGACVDGSLADNPRSNQFSVAQALRRAAVDQNAVFEVFGNDYDTSDGSCVRDYIHVTDVADAHFHAIERLLASGSDAYSETFNIGTGSGTSVLELIQLYKQGSGREIVVEFKGRRSGDVSSVVGDVAKSNATLGWRAKMSLLDACASDWQSVLREIGEA